MFIGNKHPGFFRINRVYNRRDEGHLVYITIATWFAKFTKIFLYQKFAPYSIWWQHTSDIPYNAASNCLAKSPIVRSGREFGQITTCIDIYRYLLLSISYKKQLYMFVASKCFLVPLTTHSQMRDNKNSKTIGGHNFLWCLDSAEYKLLQYTSHNI